MQIRGNNAAWHLYIFHTRYYQKAESSNDPVGPLPVGHLKQGGHNWGEDNCPETRSTCWDSWAGYITSRLWFFCKPLQIKKFTHLTGHKRAFLLKPISNSGNSWNIHQSQTKSTHNPVGDLSRNRWTKILFEFETHHQHVNIGRECGDKNSYRRNTSSSCKDKFVCWSLSCSLVHQCLFICPSLYRILVYQCRSILVQTCSPSPRILVPQAWWNRPGCSQPEHDNVEMLILWIKVLTNEILPFPAPSKWASSGFTKIPNE